MIASDDLREAMRQALRKALAAYLPFAQADMISDDLADAALSVVNKPTQDYGREFIKGVLGKPSPTREA